MNNNRILSADKVPLVVLKETHSVREPKASLGSKDSTTPSEGSKEVVNHPSATSLRSSRRCLVVKAALVVGALSNSRRRAKIFN